MNVCGCRPDHNSIDPRDHSRIAGSRDCRVDHGPPAREILGVRRSLLRDWLAGQVLTAGTPDASSGIQGPQQYLGDLDAAAGNPQVLIPPVSTPSTGIWGDLTGQRGPQLAGHWLTSRHGLARFHGLAGCTGPLRRTGRILAADLTRSLKRFARSACRGGLAHFSPPPHVRGWRLCC